jgi:hypothetical protein
MGGRTDLTNVTNNVTYESVVSGPRSLTNVISALDINLYKKLFCTTCTSRSPSDAVFIIRAFDANALVVDQIICYIIIIHYVAPSPLDVTREKISSTPLYPRLMFTISFPLSNSPSLPPLTI